VSNNNRVTLNPLLKFINVVDLFHFGVSLAGKIHSGQHRSQQVSAGEEPESSSKNYN